MSYVETPDGINLYVESTGKGDAIVFAHEFGGDWRSWRAQIAHFGSRFRCIRYCARGFHPSDVPEHETSYGQDFSTADLLAVADAMELEKFHLVGLSMGSYTSVQFALAHPQRLSSLTVVGCSSGPTERQRDGYRQDLSAQIAALDEQSGDGAVRWFSADPVYRRMPEKQPAAWEIYCDNLRAQSVRGARSTLSTLHWNRLSLFDLGDDLKRLKIPTLLVYGDEDYDLVEPTNEFLAAALPLSTIVKVERTGHLANIEEPETFNRVLEEHLERATALQEPAARP